MRTLVVEDEPLARESLHRSLTAIQDVEWVGEARDGPEAVDAILRLLPDLVVLDVQMPGFDGFEVVARVRERHLPALVFVSGYDHYALRAFDVHAVDYLLKPYSEERLRRAIERARAQCDEPHEIRLTRLLAMLADLAPERFPLRCADRFAVRERLGWRIIHAADVQWFESAGNYVQIHTADGTHLLRSTLNDLERSLDPRRFARIHRTIVVSLDRVREVRPEESGGFEVHLAGGQTLRMSRRFRDRILPKPPVSDGRSS